MRDSPITVLGEVLFDCFPDGRRVLGGAPFNVAWHLHAFGAAPHFISAVGDDEEGRAVFGAMQSWGMDTSGLQTDPHHRTGRVEVRFEDGEPSYEILDNCAFDYIRPPASHARGELLYHGTLALRRSVSAATLDAIRSTGERTVFIDVNLRAPWWSRERALGLVAAGDWVKLNRDELACLGEPPATGTDPAGSAGAFRKRHGLAGLVVTLGADGALAILGEEQPVQVAPQPALLIKDTVGAGDAFSSVLILGLVRAWPIELTLERAQAFASRIVQQQGAIAADRELYRPFQAQWGLTAPPGG